MNELEKFLKEITNNNENDSEVNKHISLAKEAQSLLGGDLKEYLRMYDRELQDAISNTKGRKLGNKDKLFLNTGKEIVPISSYEINLSDIEITLCGNINHIIIDVGSKFDLVIDNYIFYNCEVREASYRTFHIINMIRIVGQYLKYAKNNTI